MTVPALALESGEAEEASSAHFPFSSRFVLSLQQSTKAEQLDLYALQGFVDRREFTDWIAPSWKVPYCRRIDREEGIPATRLSKLNP